MLNPATFFPDEGLELAIHDCLETVSTLNGIKGDLRDYPLPNVEGELFTDGGSYKNDGIRYTRATVMTQDQVVWSQALEHGSLDQKTGLYSLNTSSLIG